MVVVKNILQVHRLPTTPTCTASVDLQVDASSLGDILEEADWDLGTEVPMTTTPVGIKGPAQAEKEIRCVCVCVGVCLCVCMCIRLFVHVCMCVHVYV